MQGWDRAGIALVAFAGSCVVNPGHRCRDDGDCLLAAEGRCELDGACSYPDPLCASERRYGKWAPPSIAEECVPETIDASTTEVSTTSSTDEDGGESSTSAPPDDPPERGPRCGNGIIDPGEACDGGGDCNARWCVPPGTVLWEQLYDGPADSIDRGHTLVVDPGGDSFYVGGDVTMDLARTTDVLVQRRRVADGELEWSWTTSHSAGADEARAMLFTPDGGLLVLGTVLSDTNDEDMWLVAFGPDRLRVGDDNEPTWELVHDHAGADDRMQGLTMTDEGSIVAVGWTEADDNDSLFVRVDADGDVQASTAVDLSAGAGNDRLHDVLADGGDLVVTGDRRIDPDRPVVWTARYNLDLVALASHSIDPPDSGDANRGISIARAPDGGIAVAGTYTGDRWLWHYDDPATLQGPISVEWAPGELHDEATGIAFDDDGRYVVCGVLDFRQGGTPSRLGDDDSEWWAAAYDPDNRERWDTSETFRGHPGTDRALAVVVVDDMAIVTGYRITSRDNVGRAVWIVAYAL